MSSSFEFSSVDSFIPGALGEPGARVFYLQARNGNDVVTLKLEKHQVELLGQYLMQLASMLGTPEPDRSVTGLIEPVDPAWIVGTLGVGIDEQAGSILVTAQELDIGSDDDDELAWDESLFEDDDGAEARFVIKPGQAVAFAEAAQELVSSGRQPCRLCGAPINPSGHQCPRWN